MIYYRAIERHIRRARLQRSAVMGDLIARGIFAFWSGAKRIAAQATAKFGALFEMPGQYSTALLRRF